MAWTAPKTFVAGNVLTAAELNTHVRDNFNAFSTQSWTWSAVQEFTANVDISGADIAVDATQRVHLSGLAGNTSIYEFDSDRIQVECGGSAAAWFFTTGMGVNSTGKIHLDGGGAGDTYITESAANIMQFFTGGTNRFTIEASGDVYIQPTKLFHPDGGGDTYISESSANVLDASAGGALAWRATATGTAKRIASRTLGVGVTTFSVAADIMVMTGDGGGNTIATITGGIQGQILRLLFVDSLISIDNDDTHGADSVDLQGTGAAVQFFDDAVLTLLYDGTSWYEAGRLLN